jgi:predicted short-subunit dehydrogenase-like oxidoreductase (DUF2520 family)
MLPQLRKIITGRNKFTSPPSVPLSQGRGGDQNLKKAMRSYKIAFAGAGKVASALSNELHSKGHSITKIVTPGKESGELLAFKYGAEWSDNLLFSDNTDLIIVAVPDHILKEVLSLIRCGKNTVVVHTAGSFGLDIFPERLTKKGVFYPLQTFTSGRRISFPEIPLFTEAADDKTGMLLKSMGESLGCKVYSADLQHRQLLHVAAVFVSNFTNYMLTSGNSISDRAGFPFEILQPLIIETVNKAIESNPANSQTGPAVRHDLNTIEKHTELLSFSPELQKVYKEISASIMNHYKKQGDE